MSSTLPYYLFDAIRRRGLHGETSPLRIAVRAETFEQARDSVALRQDWMRDVRFQRVIDRWSIQDAARQRIGWDGFVLDVREVDGTPIVLPDDDRYPYIGLKTYHVRFRWEKYDDHFYDPLKQKGTGLFFLPGDQFAFAITAKDELVASNIVRDLTGPIPMVDLKIELIERNPQDGSEWPFCARETAENIAKRLFLDPAIVLNLNFQVFVTLGVLKRWTENRIAHQWWQTFDDRVPILPQPPQMVTPERIAEIMTSALERNPSPETVHYALAVQAKLLSELGLPSPVRNS